MGNLATPESLIARWAELCRDQSLENLPYKIELNAWGKIEMSPAGNRHARLQGDIAWASDAFTEDFGEITPYMRAPEICVEIASPSNPRGELEEKVAAYLAAGAVEAWIVAQDGSLRYFDATGEKPASDFQVAISLPPPVR